MNDLKPEPKPRPLHPGEFIRKQVIEPLDLSGSSAAGILGVPRHALRNVLNGSVALSPRMALRIEMAFGTPMEKLLGMQMACDIATEREKKAAINVKRYRSCFRPRKRLTAVIAGCNADMDSIDFLPLCARVPVEHLSAVWEWATLSDHPECRYAVWSIARNRARADVEPVTSHAIIMRHFSIISAVFDGREYRGLLWTFGAEPGGGSGGPCPDLSAFHCDITREAMDTGHPEMQVLVHRILSVRAEIHSTPTEDRSNLYTDIAKNTDRIMDLKTTLDFLHYPIPPFSDLLTPEEKVYRPALAWAGAQPEGSDAHVLFSKIQRRTDSLAATKRRGRRPRNKDNKNYYIYKSGTLYVWYRKLARLYLDSPSTP
jgi:addiction module HigA family antidote